MLGANLLGLLAIGSEDLGGRGALGIWDPVREGIP